MKINQVQVIRGLKIGLSAGLGLSNPFCGTLVTPFCAFTLFARINNALLILIKLLYFFKKSFRFSFALLLGKFSP